MPTGKPGSTTYYEKTCPVCGQVNGNRQDNRLENLVLCSISEHTSIHHSANEIVYKLLDQGIVTFNRETLRYELVK